ncbi:MAG: hypothetical protein AAF447_20165 [Myxococcota bacterium]
MTLLAACAPSGAATTPPTRAAREAAPLDPGPRPPEGWPGFPLRLETAPEGLRRLRELAARPPALPLPPPPAIDGSRDPAALERWVGVLYVPWVERRSERLARAGEARRSLRDESDAVRALGAALHGHLLLATADAVRRAGEALEGEARAALSAPARPYRRAAREAFDVCYALATAAGPALDGWRRACGERLDALPPRAPGAR